ncbi:hypothetical protein AB4140_00960 [Shewanella sp. 10N.286.51.B2]|uniref:hypothetical protein n=1 Tax=Shewanella sp. 10N.286.51.B2 TaxID=3229707 RepID=UPI00354E03BA
MYIAIKLNENLTVISVYCMEKKCIPSWVLKGTIKGEYLSRRHKPHKDESIRLYAAMLALRAYSDTNQIEKRLKLSYPRWAEFVVLAEQHLIDEAIFNNT